MSALIQGISSQGGSVEPVEGIMGQELRGSVPAKSGDQTISRPTRFIGVDGPRWFLRGVISASTINEDVYARSGFDFPIGCGESGRYCNASG